MSVRYAKKGGTGGGVEPAPPEGVPSGAAIMSDAIGLFARVGLADTNLTPSELVTYALAAAYADTAAAQAEALQLGITQQDLVAAQAELAKVGVVAAELNAAQAETLALALRGLAETQATPGESVEAGLAQIIESNSAPTDTRSTNVTTWATSNTTSGTAPTNPTNGQGSNNGTLANVKAGGVANGTSTLNLFVPPGSIPASGTKQIVAYYRTNPNVGDTFTLNYASNGGTPTGLALPPGNFLTVPHTAAITAVGTNCAFGFSHQVVVIATGGSIDIDAVGVITTGATSL